MTTQQSKGLPETGASQARLAAKAVEEPEAVPSMTPSEFRLAKIEEALFERRRIDKLRAETAERVRLERKFNH